MFLVKKASTPADLSTTMASPNARNPSKITVSNLTGDHLSTFENVLSSILSTDLAQLTYSQIIDGLPVRDVWNAYACRRSDIDEHVEPCSEAIEVWKAFRDSFQSHTLQFASRTVQGYQNTTPGTKYFNVRLLELVAVACHDTAALLYQITKGGVGKHAERSPGPTILDYDGVPYPPIPTDFYHTEYRDWEQYPQGVADMVGYWAEFELFGGVVLFDRGDSEVEVSKSFSLRDSTNYPSAKTPSYIREAVTRSFNSQKNSSRSLSSPSQFMDRHLSHSRRTGTHVVLVKRNQCRCISIETDMNAN
jgi:hypothetical protein